jgi:hypothetical protein
LRRACWTACLPAGRLTPPNASALVRSTAHTCRVGWDQGQRPSGAVKTLGSTLLPLCSVPLCDPQAARAFTPMKTFCLASPLLASSLFITTSYGSRPWSLRRTSPAVHLRPTHTRQRTFIGPCDSQSVRHRTSRSIRWWCRVGDHGEFATSVARDHGRPAPWVGFVVE